MKGKHFLLLAGSLLFVVVPFLGGCSNLVLFHPKGPVGHSERFVIIAAFALMMIVVLPVIFMALWFPWKYRASNTKAKYMPKWNRSIAIDLVVWLVPVAIIMALALLTWSRMFTLDPYHPIESSAKPVTIEAVSLDWKWLFIYPDRNIAAVNQIVFPAGVPLNFRITSDSVLTSFFIPQLGSQIYAMPGRQSQLHLLAAEAGTFEGHNQQFSGKGYSDMHFAAIAVSAEAFEAWVRKVSESPGKLDSSEYGKLKTPSLDYPVTYFSSVDQGLFEGIINSYRAGDGNSTAGMNNPGAGLMKTVASEER